MVFYVTSSTYAKYGLGFFPYILNTPGCDKLTDPYFEPQYPMTTPKNYTRQLLVLVILLLVALLSLSQMCLTRPTLITVADQQMANALKADDDKFLLGPIFGKHMLVLNKVDFTTDFYGFLYRGNTSELIDANVYILGSWATDELDFMRMVTDITNGNETTVLDIGANVGTHSMFISQYAGQVHAIEPWPPILDRLRSFVTENNVSNVTIHPVGYASEEGSMPYHEPKTNNPGTGSFSTSRFPSQTQVIELPLVVGDTHLKANGITGIDLIKIDIEGYEKPALTGLRETINRDRPTVLIELNVTNDEGIKSREELTALFPNDYQYFELLKRSHRRIYPWFGEQSILCRCNEKTYTLTEFDMRFTENGPMVIAAPPEHASAFY